jgi:hypothetical protein
MVLNKIKMARMGISCGVMAWDPSLSSVTTCLVSMADVSRLLREERRKTAIKSDCSNGRNWSGYSPFDPRMGDFCYPTKYKDQKFR